MRIDRQWVRAIKREREGNKTINGSTVRERCSIPILHWSACSVADRSVWHACEASRGWGWRFWSFAESPRIDCRESSSRSERRVPGWMSKQTDGDLLEKSRAVTLGTAALKTKFVIGEDVPLLAWRWMNKVVSCLSKVKRRRRPFFSNAVIGGIDALLPEEKRTSSVARSGCVTDRWRRSGKMSQCGRTSPPVDSRKKK